MTPYYQDDAVTIYHGDCMDVLLPGSPRHPRGCVTADLNTATRELLDAARPFAEMAQEMLTGHVTGRIAEGAPERFLHAMASLEALVQLWKAPDGRPGNAQVMPGREETQ